MNISPRPTRRHALAAIALSLLALTGCTSSGEPLDHGGVSEVISREVITSDDALPEPVTDEVTRLAAIRADMEADKAAARQDFEDSLAAAEARRVLISGIQEDLVAMDYLWEVTGKSGGSTTRALYDLGYDTNLDLIAADDEAAAAVAELRASGHTNPPTPPGVVAVRTTEAYQEAQDRCLKEGFGCPGTQGQES